MKYILPLFVIASLSLSSCAHKSACPAYNNPTKGKPSQMKHIKKEKNAERKMPKNSGGELR